MTTYTFREIGLYPKKSGKCPACGKRATRSKHIYQTLNPYNRNKETGEVKTAEEIYAEVKVATAAWKDAPTYHARCEP
jgi:hypothetical protein